VLGRREHCRSTLVEAAQALGAMLLQAGRPAEAAEACGAGIRVDRYQDSLWQLLIAARERAGEVGAAGRARAEYDRVLAELGVAATRA
jgi:predicted Zn-dependent protease